MAAVLITDLSRAAGPGYEIVPARIGDLQPIEALAKRLTAFELPHWRREEDIIAAELKTIRSVLHESCTGVLWVARTKSGLVLGFCLVEIKTDYFTNREHGHISALAVAVEHEGIGIGRALIAHAASWAESLGHPFLSLNVFATNLRARKLYESVGFHPDTMKYTLQIE